MRSLEISIPINLKESFGDNVNIVKKFAFSLLDRQQDCVLETLIVTRFLAHQSVVKYRSLVSIAFRSCPWMLILVSGRGLLNERLE